ncbi:MAG: hypothetical protein HOQ09_05480 [Gemmatimonadaceae bacterium]|nr:hypothetical protein [Gemmatimonadaceae bacterium]
MVAPLVTRAALGAGLLLALASPLRAQHTDTTRTDAAKKKPTHQMPMTMPMDMGDSTHKHAKPKPTAKPTAKKPARPAPRKPASAAPATHADTTHADTSHAAHAAHDSTHVMPRDSTHAMSHDTVPPTRTDSMRMPMPRDSAMRDSVAGHQGRMAPMARDTMAHAMPAHDTIAGHGMTRAMALMTGALGIPMERMGSGTTWIPDAVRLPSRHVAAKGWDVMVHGFVFGQYDQQSGARGDSQLGSLNWGMLMVSRDVAGGMFQARTMLSLDPATVGNRGYPLLLQSGEAYRGQPLHDRQHPHDFLMELAALYERGFTDDLAWSLYVAPSGEPALGPVAFMHRTSAMDIPTANITHHWQDATHISFGVVTGGVFTRRVKLEGSVFNGREPDERRWDIDPIRLDSYSGRLTVNPSAHWSMTAGYGRLKSPEAMHPEESLHRVTASLLHGTTLGADGQWSSAFIWGMNKFSGHRDPTHGVLAETEAVLDAHNTVFARGEYVQKSADDLVLDDASVLPVGTPVFDANHVFEVAAISAGYIREIGRWRWATIGLGAQGTLDVVPGSLAEVYGSRTPVGAVIFVRLRPFHEGMGGM